MKHVVVVGGSGLIGSHLIRLLARRRDVRVTALVRRAGSIKDDAGIAELVFPFDDEDAYSRIGRDIPCDILFCCLGTTLRRAGSVENFVKVDRDIPMRLFYSLRKLPHSPLVLAVSSLGANQALGLYLETKAQMESALRETGLSYVIVRPSLLLGARRELRLGETLMACLSRPIFSTLAMLSRRRWAWVGRLAPIPAVTVAEAMVRAAFDTRGQFVSCVLEGWDLYPSHKRIKS